LGEFQAKLSRLRGWLEAEKLKGVCLGRRASFAWLFGGASNTVRQDVEGGQAWALVSKDGVKVVTNAIEAPRVLREEIEGFGADLESAPWQSGPAALAAKACDVSDNGDFGLPARYAELSRLRALLLPGEIERLRLGGKLCAEAMLEGVSRLKKGASEFGIASELSRSLWSRGVLPAVLLVGGDERQISFRHAIPTALPVHRHAMLVICGNYKGLILSLTRLISFGEAPEGLVKKQLACLQVEAAMWKASQPGARSGEVFAAAKAEYAAQGFPGEELKHHQGGAAGYEPREWLGGVHDELIVENSPLAWNPSIMGAKSEDTILCGASGHEILTTSPGWPSLKITHAGAAFERPGFLNLEAK